jgi:hypothetical protein
MRALFNVSASFPYQITAAIRPPFPPMEILYREESI